MNHEGLAAFTKNTKPENFFVIFVFVAKAAFVVEASIGYKFARARFSGEPCVQSAESGWSEPYMLDSRRQSVPQGAVLRAKL